MGRLAPDSMLTAQIPESRPLEVQPVVDTSVIENTVPVFADIHAKRVYEDEWKRKDGGTIAPVNGEYVTHLASQADSNLSQNASGNASASQWTPGTANNSASSSSDGIGGGSIIIPPIGPGTGGFDPGSGPEPGSPGSGGPDPGGSHVPTPVPSTMLLLGSGFFLLAAIKLKSGLSGKRQN